MSDFVFDATEYVKAPVLTIGSAVALVDALSAARLAGKHEPDSVARARKRLEHAGAQAKRAMAARQRQLGDDAPPTDPALDAAADNAWSALRMRLLAWTQLPAQQYEQSSRAAALLQQLFADEGLGFLKLPYADQWAAMGARLDAIDDEGLSRALESLAGREFLAHARAVQKRYGAMVRAMLQRDEAGERLIDYVRAVQKAMVDYALKVAATVDEDDAESAARAAAALGPITTFREIAARRAASSLVDDVAKPGEAKPADTKRDADAGAKKG